MNQGLITGIAKFVFLPIYTRHWVGRQIAYIITPGKQEAVKNKI